jgi:NTE family protein
MHSPFRCITEVGATSGTARGWAHIGTLQSTLFILQNVLSMCTGVIRALEEHGIHPHVVCGTSMGSLVAAAYASNKLHILEEFARVDIFLETYYDH